MKQDIVTVRNRDTGRVGKVRRSIVVHPVFGERLEIVPDGTKKLVRLEDVPNNLIPYEEEDSVVDEDYE